MAKYKIEIVKTYEATVTAESEDEAYNKYHNEDQYDLLTCVDETTTNIWQTDL